MHRSLLEKVYILVNISYFDTLRQISHFFAVQNVDDTRFVTPKKSAWQEKSPAGRGTISKNLKKGIDFMDKTRYNLYLRKIELRTGGVIHAQH